MKKTTLLTILALSFLAVPLSAFEAGGTIGNSTELYTNDGDPVALEQKNKISAYFKVPFANTFYFITEGSITPTFNANDISELDDGDFTSPVDLTLAKVSDTIKFQGNSTLTLSAGRFSIADSTGLVLNQGSDGISAVWASPKLSATAYAGYTGLLNGHTTTVLNGNIEDSDNDYYYLASPFMLGQASVYLPYLFFNQSLGFEALAAIGLDGPNGDNSDYNRFYGTVSLDGALAKGLFYSLSSTFELESFDGYDFDDPANLTRLALTYHIPDFHSTQITASAVYASGENGPFTFFSGITSEEASYSPLAPEYSSLVKTGLSASIKPLDNMLASLGTDVIFSYLEDDLEYSGVQFYGGIVYQWFTDLQVGLQAHQYIGDDSDENETSVTLNLTLAF